MQSAVKEDPTPRTASLTEEPLGPERTRAARRLLAGVLLDQGLADKQVAKRWRQSVLDGSWSTDACADEVLASAGDAATDARVTDRAGRLLRDFLMAPMQRGLRGAARRGRERTRSLFAYVLVQAFVFAIFSLIVTAILVLLRNQGHSLDGWADWVLGWLPDADSLGS